MNATDNMNNISVLLLFYKLKYIMQKSIWCILKIFYELQLMVFPDRRSESQ